jgi:hypothetical protein
VISSWLSPVLIGITAVFLGRSHYTIYVSKRGNRFSLVTTWLATLFVIGFWTWQWALK